MKQSRRKFLAVCAGSMAGLSGCIFGGDDDSDDTPTTTPNNNTTDDDEPTPTPQPTPTASFKTEFHPADGRVVFTHGGGDTIDTAKLVSENGELDTSAAGEQWEPTEEVVITGIGRAENAVLTWETDQKSVTLARFTAPDRPLVDFTYEYDASTGNTTITHAGGAVLDTTRIDFSEYVRYVERPADLRWREGESVVVTGAGPREAIQVLWSTSPGGNSVPIDTEILLPNVKVEGTYNPEAQQLNLTLTDGDLLDFSHVSFESDTGVTREFIDYKNWNEGETITLGDVLETETVTLTYTTERGVTGELTSFSPSDLPTVTSDPTPTPGNNTSTTGDNESNSQ